jgi:hypothetical protein
MQWWPLGGASGALAPAVDFEGGRKGGHRPTGHTLIRSSVAWCRRYRDNRKYAWFALITFQLCLRSAVDASWSRCVAHFYVPEEGGGRPLFALPRLSHGQRPALMRSTWISKYFFFVVCTCCTSLCALVARHNVHLLHVTMCTCCTSLCNQDTCGVTRAQSRLFNTSQVITCYWYTHRCVHEVSLWKVCERGMCKEGTGCVRVGFGCHRVL